jgi:hypothetical protein
MLDSGIGQGRLHSLQETLTDVFIGGLVAWPLSTLCFYIFWDLNAFLAGLYTTLVFACTSTLRKYILRRWFNSLTVCSDVSRPDVITVESSLGGFTASFEEFYLVRSEFESVSTDNLLLHLSHKGCIKIDYVNSLCVSRLTFRGTTKVVTSERDNVRDSLLGLALFIRDVPLDSEGIQ